MNPHLADRPRSGLALLAAGLLAAALLAGCGRETPVDLIRSARDYQARNDHQAAIIQLKNALQKQPDNGEARLLLGQSSLVIGDPATAEKEFRKAAEFGQPAAVVMPLIAQAMLENGAIDKVVAEFAGRQLDDAKADAALRAAVGQAQMRMGRLDDATASYAAALTADPANLQAQLGQVRVLAFKGEVDQATASIDRIVAAHPASADALLLQGALRTAKGDRDGARTALEAAVAADPARAQARLELISLLIVDGQYEAASAQVAEARKLRGGDLRLLYFDALIAFERKDYAKARELAQQLVKSAPEHVPSLVLAGAVELQERQLTMAETHLQKAVLLSPEHEGARKLLVRTYMSTNQPARALEVIQPLLAAGRRIDASTMMLAGETYLANGDIKQASTYFSSATQSKPQETAARIRLGQIALVSGDAERGIKELEAATAAEGAPMQADLALIAGYMRRNESARALEAAQALAKKQPKEPIAFQVLGSVQAARKDVAGARASFTQALALNPTYLPAVQSLARLDLADRKPAEARARFDAVLAKEPNNELALIGLADVMAATQAPPKEIATVLQRAIAVRSQSATARLALIRLYLQEKDARAALAAAQEAAIALPEDRRILEALGRAQQAAGETNQAIETFTRLAALQPDSTLPLLRLASVYGGAKETDKAIEVLLRAQKLAPADPAIGRDLVLGYLMAGKVDQALAQARSLQAKAPKSATGFMLEGDIYATTKQWVPAERAYRDALKAEPDSGVSAAKLHGALVAAGRKSEAETAARKWLAEHPRDAGLRMYLAEQALRAKDYKAAVGYYQVVVREQPENVAALNNLAWAAGQVGDPKAVAYAEQALKLAPDSPLVLDTVGVLVAASGDANRGVEYLARAVTLAPDRPDIRFNYAKALMKAGKTEQARKELTQLQAVEQDFSGKSEVAGLLKQLP
jgi:putative PEP-CTERM system TPR-repeat lipoprotein